MKTSFNIFVAIAIMAGSSPAQAANVGICLKAILGAFAGENTAIGSAPIAPSPVSDPEIEVKIVGQIANEGWDNMGVYEVESPSYPGQRLVAKITSYQSDFDMIATANERLAETTPLAAAYKGRTTIKVRGRALKAYVTEFVDGIVSKDEDVLARINETTMRQAEEAFRQILAAGILPLDFQFMVKQDGSIKVIDADLYATPELLNSNPTIRDGMTTVRDNTKRLLNKIRKPEMGDMIWGERFFMRTPPDFVKRSIQLLEELKAQGWPAVGS